MKNGKKMLCFALILGLLLPCLSGCAAANGEDLMKGAVIQVGQPNPYLSEAGDFREPTIYPSEAVWIVDQAGTCYMFENGEAEALCQALLAAVRGAEQSEYAEEDLLTRESKWFRMRLTQDGEAFNLTLTPWTLYRDEYSIYLRNSDEAHALYQQARALVAQQDAPFVNAQMAFALDLFQRTVKDNEGENVLVSPMSLSLALAMTANGGVGETLRQMERLLGQGMSISELNVAFRDYVNHLPTSEDARLQLANAIWFKDTPDFTVSENFLAANAAYYGAGAYQAPFDEGTRQEINRWVKEKTDGMIDGILDKPIDSDAVMFLLNALVFEAKWQAPYEKTDVFDAPFYSFQGGSKTVEMLPGGGQYYEDDQAVGVGLRYLGGDYAFIALMPKEGVDIQDYVADLDPAALLQTLAQESETAVHSWLPKFKMEGSYSLVETLAAMGIPNAFQNAEFSGMGQSSSPLKIAEVLQKTFLQVDEDGTKAAAATSVQMNLESAMMEPAQAVEVHLDHPFVYMIVDTRTNLPLFLGVAMDLGK